MQGSPKHTARVISVIVRTGMATRGFPGEAIVVVDDDEQIDIQFERDGVRCPVSVGGVITNSRSRKDLAELAIARFAEHYESV